MRETASLLPRRDLMLPCGVCAGTDQNRRSWEDASLPMLSTETQTMHAQRVSIGARNHGVIQAV